MMAVPLLFFVCFTAWLHNSQVMGNECVNDYTLYATKTAYATVRGNEEIHQDQDCTPLTLWFLSRHGTRYNKVKDQEATLTKIQNDIINNDDQGSLCDATLEALAGWRMQMRPEDDMKLAETGWNELRGIGSRLKARYPSLFQAYTPEGFSICHTNYSGGGDRTRDTARAWAQGAFGSYEGIVLTENSRPDMLLHFYKYCDKYIQEVGNSDVIEQINFINGPEMREVLRETGQLLGLDDNYFNYGKLDDVYEMCRVERGIYGYSPWCEILTPKVLRVFEFTEDLKYYWEDSYGYEINYEQSCTLLSDLMSAFRETLNNNRKTNVAARFGHSQTLNAFFTRIGLFNDGEDLKSDGFIRQANRKLRVSLHTPMASNAAIVHSQCPSGHVVEAFVNEKPTEISGCDGFKCPYERVESLWGHIADDCDIEEICKVDTGRLASSANGKNVPVYQISFIIMFFLSLLLDM